MSFVNESIDDLGNNSSIDTNCTIRGIRSSFAGSFQKSGIVFFPTRIFFFFLWYHTIV